MALNLGNKEKNLVAWGFMAFVAFVLAPPFVEGYAQRYQQTQVSAKDIADKRVRELRENLSGIEGRKEILRRYINRYRALVDREIILPPDTVALVKHMKAISLRRKQEATTFNFGTNLSVPSEESKYTAGSSVGVEVYPLVLNMGMLHDMDMFMFLESLKERVSNISFPVRCSLELDNLEFEVAKRQNMTAECQINWYSVNDPERNIKSEGEEVVPAEAAEAEAQTASIAN